MFRVIIHDQSPLVLMKDFHLGEKMRLQYVNKQIRDLILRKIYNGNVPMEENAAQTWIFGVCFVVGASLLPELVHILILPRESQTEI